MDTHFVITQKSAYGGATACRKGELLQQVHYKVPQSNVAASSYFSLFPPIVVYHLYFIRFSSVPTRCSLRKLFCYCIIIISS